MSETEDKFFIHENQIFKVVRFESIPEYDSYYDEHRYNDYIIGINDIEKLVKIDRIDKKLFLCLPSACHELLRHFEKQQQTSKNLIEKEKNKLESFIREEENKMLFLSVRKGEVQKLLMDGWNKNADDTTSKS